MSFLSLLPVVFLLLLTSACSNRASKLPQYGNVPAFTMTTSAGKPFNADELDGHVTIVDFIYTHCPGPCPMMSSKMRGLETGNDEPDLRFLSISVDPAQDTPPVLQAFAQHFGAPSARWTFLTGDANTVHLLARETFKMGDVITVLDHSTKFALVDKRRQLRGYYSSFDPEALVTMMADAKALLRVTS